MLALFRKTNSRHPRTEASSAGPRPGTMARGSPRALRCSCQTIRHANVPHGVLKEPSKRRRSLKPQSHKPLKDSPLWIHSAARVTLPEYITTCQATRPASTATDRQQVQHRHLIYASRSSLAKVSRMRA